MATSTQQGNDIYLRNKIMTATPAELTLLLYEGAIKFANKAIMAIEKNDMQNAHNNIMRTQHIIQEFRATLNHKYPVAKDFEAVYEYVERRLVEANIKKDIEILEELLSLGGLGIQYCIKSELAYSKLTEVEDGPISVDYSEFNEKYNGRDIIARKKMRELVDSDANKVTNVFSTLFER